MWSRGGPRRRGSASDSNGMPRRRAPTRFGLAPLTAGARRSGHYIVSNALQPSRTARTIRVRGGTISTTDGPFAETTEQLGGFFLIEAKDIDEACAVASRFPPARIAIIEVRPVQELTHS